jgi:hypothetical protein
LTNAALLQEVARLASQERHATARLVAALAEMDARRLYLGEGCSSLFTYCTQVLHLSEHAAYGRIEAARAGRRFPVILEMLASGDLTLTAVGLLARHLTPENHADVLRRARHKSKREVEEIVASLRPLPDVKPSVRRQPSVKTSAPQWAALSSSDSCDAAMRTAAPVTSASSIEFGCPDRMAQPSPPRPLIRPIAPERYVVRLTISRDTSDKLRRAQDLLRHVVPDGDPAVIFDRALTALLQDLENRRLAAATRPRECSARPPRGRHIPAAVRRAVWKRDGGRCAFIGAKGRCSETGFLEFHHVDPFGAGGEATVDNLELRCRAHNQYEADLFFGPLIARERPPVFGADSACEPSLDFARDGSEQAEGPKRGPRGCLDRVHLLGSGLGTRGEPSPSAGRVAAGGR